MTHTLRSNRFALISCVVVLGLASCGSRSDIKSAAKPAAKPKVIVVGSNPTAGNQPAATTGAGRTQSADVESGKMMAPMSITYTYTGDTIDLTAPAPAWFFPTGTTPSKESIAAIAAALGVSGDVVELPADQGGGWMVGDTTYVGANMTVSADAMHSWWYNAPQPPATNYYECGVAVDPAYSEPLPPDASTPAIEVSPETDVATTEPASPGKPVDPVPVPTQECEAPAPPVNVPTKEQAEAKATEFLTTIGVDPTQIAFETYADEWGAYVTAFLVLDGVRSNVSSSIGFGAEGAVTWASGFLATPERGGDYPRVGIDAAIQRLNDQSAQWRNYGLENGAGIAGGSDGDVSVDAPLVEPDTAPADTAPADTVVTGTAPAEPVGTESFIEPVECGPAVDCAPFPSEPITIELSNAHPTLEQIWAEDGTVWLVPGYGFDSADQGIYSVIAIDDSFLQVQQPVPVDVPPAPPETIVAIDPVAVDCPLFELPTEFTVPGPNIAAASSWIGLCTADADAYAAALGYEMRIVRQDGVDLPATADYRDNRFNVAVVNGIVTEVISQG
jgi:hypothetical protein